MIFNLHQTNTDKQNPVLVFDDSDQAWECLDMLDKAFPQNSQRQYIIVCFNQYENAVMICPFSPLITGE